MSTTRTAWLALYAAAARRGGIVTPGDATEHGVPDRSLRARATRDEWVRLGGGAWLVAGAPRTARTVHHAALASLRPDGVLSHDTALDLLGLRDQPPHDDRIHVVVPHGRSALPPDGVVRHRSRRLEADDRTVVDRLDVTTAARAITDVSASLATWRIEALVLAGRQRGLLTLDDVRRQVARRPTLRGTAKVRTALDEIGDATADSILERRCRTLLLDNDVPVSNGPVSVDTPGGRLAVDLCVGRRVAVECDGRAYHAGDVAFERDRERWPLLQEAGWKIVWVTWVRLHRRPSTIVEEVRRRLAEVG